MSDQLLGMLSVLRRRKRIRTSLLLPLGSDMAPIIPEPIELIGDIYSSDRGDEPVSSELPPSITRQERRLSRRSFVSDFRVDIEEIIGGFCSAVA